MYEIDLENCPSDIKVKKYTYETTQYKILNCDPNNLLYDSNEGMYRSVIVSEPENKVLSFSHPRSLPLESFQSKYPDIGSTKIHVNEIVEGTMTQLFYDSRIRSWQIATKGAIGGNYWFYRTIYPTSGIHGEKQKSFREMFLDVFPPLETFYHFPKEYCYQFILQHPDNHIVLNLEKPSLYLVGVYEIAGKVVTTVYPTEYETWDCFKEENINIKFPQKFTENSYELLIENWCSRNSDYRIVGCMLTHLETGERASIENPVYREVRELRGNHPNLQYQYLSLRRIDKVQEFLRYFPQYKKIFYRFYKQYCDFLTNLHQSYLTYYIQKRGIKISKKYFPLVYRIHHIVYLPSLNTGEKKIMRMSEIAKFLKEMEPSELIYYLNYHLEDNLEDMRIMNKEHNNDIAREIVV